MVAIDISALHTFPWGTPAPNESAADSTLAHEVSNEFRRLPIGGRRLCAAVREFYALERMAEQDEIMGLALFLASRYLTGAQIVIDGGGLRLAD